MVKIPKGKFIFGINRKEYGDSTKIENIKGFWIDKYPVTNEEYKKFIDDNPNILVPYIDEKWAMKYNWNIKKRTYPNQLKKHPVVMVKRKYILQYCKWINKRLPTEIEWEKAARGINGFLYPWGNTWIDDRANTKEYNIQGTTPVMLFKKFSSPFGVVDLIGNVWEWTSTPYEYSGFVVRGGSWQMNSNLVNCCSRSGLVENYISSALGWRCVKDE